MKQVKKQSFTFQAIVVGAIAVFIIAGLFSGVGGKVLNDLQAQEATTTNVVNESVSPSAANTRVSLTEDCIDTSGTIVVTNESNETATSVFYKINSGNYTVSLDDEGNSYVSLLTGEFAGDALNITYPIHSQAWCSMQYSEGGIGNLSSQIGLLGTLIILGVIVTVLIMVFGFMRIRL